jgi:signal transduction histidine kinase
MTVWPTVRQGFEGDYSAYDLLPDAVVMVAPDGRVAHLNDLARRLLGMNEDLPIGRPAEEVLPLIDEGGGPWWSIERPLDADPRLHTRIPERELLLWTPRGERPVTLTGARSSLDGGTWLVLVLRRAERRQRLDAARSELVATVSHELRSPLTAVKGFTKTLLAKWDRFTDEQKQQMLATVNADADRVTRLLGELLDVSRIDAGRLQLRRRRVALRPLTERVVDRVGAGTGGSQVEVAVPATLRDLYADEDKIEQILTNLVENAIKYGRGRIRVSAVEDGDHVRLTVFDEGGGIDRQHLRHLFTKFYRGGAERRTGTGLGLYISKGITEAHGGKVWAESDPASGTSFHVLLPFGEMPGGVEHVQGNGLGGG